MASGGKRRIRITDTRRAVVYAVLVHLALIALVVVGLRWQASPEAPLPMQARVVSEADVRKEIEQRKRAEREPKAAEPAKKREVEEKPRPDPAKLNEQKRREDDRRKALDAEKKRQTELKKQKDTEERRKAAESTLKEMLTQEEQERSREQASAEAARAQKELSRIEGLIKQKVERNWVRPAGWTQGVECVVRVRLIPTGEVLGVTVVRSCGDPAFDRSVENAVYKASPLPLPEDKSLYEHFRELELRFRPEGKG